MKSLILALHALPSLGEKFFLVPLYFRGSSGGLTCPCFRGQCMHRREFLQLPWKPCHCRCLKQVKAVIAMPGFSTCRLPDNLKQNHQHSRFLSDVTLFLLILFGSPIAISLLKMLCKPNKKPWSMPKNIFECKSRDNENVGNNKETLRPFWSAGRTAASEQRQPGLCRDAVSTAESTSLQERLQRQHTKCEAFAALSHRIKDSAAERQARYAKCNPSKNSSGRER